MSFNYVVGSIFPTIPGTTTPNVIYSSSLKKTSDDGTTVFVQNDAANTETLETSLTISSKPVEIGGLNDYINYLNQSSVLTPTEQEKTNVLSTWATNSPQQSTSLWGNWLNKVLSQWGSTPVNNSLEDLLFIGYDGQYANDANSNVGRFANNGIVGDEIWNDVINPENYGNSNKWEQYVMGLGANPDSSAILHSDFDPTVLRLFIENPEQQDKLWYPSFLYTYSYEDENNVIRTAPGPVLLIEPGDRLQLNMSNRIEVPGFTETELEQATFIANSSYGSGASGGLGGSLTTNIHFHGVHNVSTGFGDNVVARYTTGQDWQSTLDFTEDSAVGSYWIHPHYHPSVNQMVYGGLSAPLQIGDPLSKIPGLENVPRNVATLKTLNIDLARVDNDATEFETNREGKPDTVEFANWDNLGGNVYTPLVLVTVNGEYQPNRTLGEGEGGWQSFSFSNQSNNAGYNISFEHYADQESQTGGERLPIWIYGEDGHQLPQIRPIIGGTTDGNEEFPGGGTLGKFTTKESQGRPVSTDKTPAYVQASNQIALPPGKRVEVLVYLPEGSIDVVSLKNWKQELAGNDGESPYSIIAGGVANRTRQAAIGQSKAPQSFGALATINVTDTQFNLSNEDQQRFIQEINETIPVQNVTPDTRPEDYDPSKVPSVNLFEEINGEEVWKPVRERVFNWTRNSLVGPRDEWSISTQEFIDEQVNAGNISSADDVKRYHGLTSAQASNVSTAQANAGANLPDFKGYGNPFLINDEVFPFGPLITTQIGTVEEWQHNNWSIAKPWTYISHPFHIHINDYQVKNSDSELQNKRNLEDVTGINSSGYKAIELNNKGEVVLNAEGEPNIVSENPLRGDLITIPEAMDASIAPGLNTYGANTQTIKMTFQDYLGVYLFHCHILPHEDAGMMMAVMVIENTDSSWLLPGYNLEPEEVELQGREDAINGKTMWELDLYLAESLETKELNVITHEGAKPVNSSVGDINNDFVQDILIASQGDGKIRLYDGASLLNSDTTRKLTTIDPMFCHHNCDEPHHSEGSAEHLAPWSFINDFTGDGQNDIIIAGFTKTRGPGDQINLHDLQIQGWVSDNPEGTEWSLYETQSGAIATFMPFDGEGSIPLHGEHDLSDANDHHGGHEGHDDSETTDHHENIVSLEPLSGLTIDDVGIVTGDWNLDNFTDIAIAYATERGIRLVVLDGAVLSLSLQQDQFEGGYFPGQSLLADALLDDPSLRNVDEINLSSGFNSYGQIALENIVLSTSKNNQGQFLTLQLEAGHFIATDLPPSDTNHSSHANHGGGSGLFDYMVTNNDAITGFKFPVHIVDRQTVEIESADAFSATAGFAGAQANGGVLLGGLEEIDDPTFVISQGASAPKDGRGDYFVGNRRTSNQLINNGAQGLLAVDGLQVVNRDDLTGIKTDYDPDSQVDARNLTNLLFRTYLGQAPDPSVAALLTAKALKNNLEPTNIVNKLLRRTPDSSQLIEDQFGVEFLNQASVETIVQTTANTLWARDANRREIRKWSKAVENGLRKKYLPLAILESSSGDDAKRVALLSGIAQWSNFQWATEANINGSYSQGLQSQIETFNDFDEIVDGIGTIETFAEANRIFDDYKDVTLEILSGSEISNTGFF